MSEHVDPLQFILDSAKKTSLSGLLLDLVRQFHRLVNSLFGDSSKLAYQEGNHHSAAMDPIDISSSDDSDFREIDAYASYSPVKDSATSSSHRVLPSWPLPSSSNARGAGSSRPHSVPNIKQSSNASGSTPSIPAIQQMHASSSGNDRSSRSFVAGRHSSPYLIEDDDMDSEWHSSKRAKRTLPSSLQPPLSRTRPNNFVENIGGSQFRDGRGTFYQPARAFPKNGESYMKDRFGIPSGMVMQEKKGIRVLPESLVSGKSPNSSAYGYGSEPSQNWGIGEENAAGTDERLVFQAALQDINQPKTEVTMPEGLLSVSLLRHQKIALAWMIKRETEGRNCLGGMLADDQGLGKTVSMIAIIQMHKSLQEESKSENLCSTKAEAFNLDEDDEKNEDGALHKQKQILDLDDVKVVSEEISSIPNFHNRKPAAGTLVVCPASVLRQWARELEEKVAEDAKLSVLIYHGGNRTKDAVELAKYDVVLTTYAIVTNEVPKQPSVDEEENEQNNGDRYGLSSEFAASKKPKKGPVRKRGKKRKNDLDDGISDPNCGTIARVRWFRVILDEAQIIKNHRTQVARACCSLRAKRRWCLSGTPIQNAIEELFSYFRFLKYEPYCKYKAFYQGIKLPISRDSARGYAKLQLILRSIMLRRTKDTLLDGQPIISLPPKDIQLTKVEFSPEERSYYTSLEAETRKQFKAYAAAGTVNQNYANILLMLLRLRQACDHPLLVEGIKSNFAGKGSLGIAKSLPKEKLGCLLNLLEASLAICSVCQDPPEDAVVSVCEHVFCFQCISDHLTGEDNTCPVFRCKTQLNADVLFSKSALKRCLYGDESSDPSSSSGFYDKSSVLSSDYSSSKIKAALEILLTYCSTISCLEMNSFALSNENFSFENQFPGALGTIPTKAIVFSQWTSMLDLLEVSLKNTDLIYRRLDGGMSLAARDKAVKEFNTNPEVTVMLMSLKAGNLGLNMVAACRVILLDLWWNPTTEDQAIDRAHRIGQTRPVVVSRLTVKDSVEDRILALQAEKRKMVASAFGEDQSGGSATRLTMEDLKYLFGV